MFKRKKKDEQPSASTWTSSTSVVPEPPKPVQFTARQLAYLHSLLASQLMMAELTKTDGESINVIKGAHSAVHNSMRDWWKTVELPEPQTFTVSVDWRSAPGKTGGSNE